MGIHPRFCCRWVDSSLLVSNFSNIAVIMMRDLFVLCLVPLAVLSTPMPYKDDGYDKDYKGDSYDGDSYTKDDGYGKKLVCKPVYDTVYKEYCENYYDRICRTTHTEKCTDVPYQHCDAVLTNQQKRKCFEVEEVVCKLREDVKYQTVQVGFTVQKCNKVQERVCDAVYDVTSSTKEKNICINVHNPYCKHEEKTIIDRTCRTSTKFDCPTEYGYGKDSYRAQVQHHYGQGLRDCSPEVPRREREAALSQRGQEGLPARGAHAAQAGEEVRLHQAVPQGPQEGLRERRQQIPRPLVRALRAQGVHLPPGGVLRRGPQEALLQGRQAGQEGEVRGVQGRIPRPRAGILKPVVYLKYNQLYVTE